MAKSAVSLTPTREDFEALLAESYSDNPASEGSVVKGRVVAVENDFAIIDVGLKTEGRVALKEFTGPGREQAPECGGVRVHGYVKHGEHVACNGGDALKQAHIALGVSPSSSAAAEKLRCRAAASKVRSAFSDGRRVYLPGMRSCESSSSGRRAIIVCLRDLAILEGSC